MSGSLGFSTLICLLNNGDRGQTETDANLLGPFWRMDSPPTKNGGSIVRSPTPGPMLFVDAWFRDADGKPIAGAEVDVWHSSTEGFYENQDPVAGRHEPARQVHHRQGRPHQLSAASSRPAIRSRSTARSASCCAPRAGTICGPRICTSSTYKPGFKTLISQIYDPEDKNIETDVQFGVTRHLIGNYVRHDERVPARRRTSRRRGIRSSILSSWKAARRACRGRRSPARRKASGRRFRISKRCDVLLPTRGEKQNKRGGTSCDAEHCSKAWPRPRQAACSSVRAAADSVAQDRHQHADHRRRLQCRRHVSCRRR